MNLRVVRVSASCHCENSSATTACCVVRLARKYRRRSEGTLYIVAASAEAGGRMRAVTNSTEFPKRSQWECVPRYWAALFTQRIGRRSLPPINGAHLMMHLRYHRWRAV